MEPHDDKPVLIYDGKCGFCKIWIDYWRTLTGDAVTYAASQDVGDRYPQIPKEAFSRSVQLVLPSGEVISGARAVFEILANDHSRRWMLTAYEGVPGFAVVSEVSYRVIASRRNIFYWITVLLFGRTVQPLRFESIAWLFTRALALVCLVAFVSFGVQSRALIGSHGVEPVAYYFQRVREALGPGGFIAAPSVFWLGASDTMIQAVWICGALCSALALAGVMWRGALSIAFVCYLSLLNGSQEFLGYQWDILLLETIFLTLFLGYSRVVIWMSRWLLFRLMFLSGVVKLISGDPTWRNLTALTVHFQTQPIPTPLAWYAHQMPVALLKTACLFTLTIELAVPFLIFGPRRIRAFAAAWLIALQIMIILTGNYAFFNWLSIALCLFLFDDGHLRTLLRRRTEPVAGRLHVRRRIALAAAVIIGVLSILNMLETLRFQLPAGARSLITTASPFGITSSYGLFANMTTTRPEIVIEGSNDGTTWAAYAFRYKPGPLDRRPPWVAPHQPRLDWQMWFAALGSFRENVWLVNLAGRLLRNEPAVLAQFERNPFEAAAPKLVRASVYDYRFTDRATRAKTGRWWTRTPIGLYLPPVSLADLSQMPALKRAGE